MQRWPAVPNPANRAPSITRSISASGITTIGFLPPSSRHGDCKCLPASSPSLRPTAVDPVNPILSTYPASKAASRPAKVVSPLAITTRRTSFGTPPACNSSVIAIAIAPACSAGFHTTELPVSNAGMKYQDGTAAGKFAAVMIITAPTGFRKVNNCLSGISLGMVWPYMRRPSPKKKSQVSITSCTSPSASA